VPIFLAIVFLVVLVLVFVLREKKSVNKHKKNLQYNDEVKQDRKKNKKI
jgi:cbb3-type cytochrome oxidase subunit 3